MAQAQLTIDIDALTGNWRTLDARSAATTRTAAVLKADAYGLGIGRVAPALQAAGVETFCIAQAEEGAELRGILGAGPEIIVLSGYMKGDRALCLAHDLTPVLNSPEQLARFAADLPGHPCGIQLDTGMNRMGFEADELTAALPAILALNPVLVMSHLACADEPGHPMNRAQLAAFETMTEALPGIRRSLAATGGILLGAEYHFDMVRPGIGLHGTLPFAGGRPAVTLSLPVIQTRRVTPGEAVGYGATHVVDTPRQIATVSAGYADGLPRALSGKATLWAGATPCPLVGRVSMDLITVDVTELDTVPDTLDILGPHQGADALADAAGTIGYEILTSLGSRYARVYKGGIQG